MLNYPNQTNSLLDTYVIIKIYDNSIEIEVIKQNQAKAATVSASVVLINLFTPLIIVLNKSGNSFIVLSFAIHIHA